LKGNHQKTTKYTVRVRTTVSNPKRQLLHMYSTRDELLDSNLVLSPPPITHHLLADNRGFIVHWVAYKIQKQQQQNNHQRGNHCATHMLSP